MSLPCVRFVIATVLLGAVSWSAPDPSVQLRELNNDLLQIHADIERGPSRAAALRAQAAIVLEERTAALELLIAQDARIALSFAFPPEVLARLSAAFPGSASALESHGTWEGELQYLIFDDAALTMHSSLRRLRSGRDMLHVYFIGSEPENLKSGDHLRVTGVRVGSIVIAQDARVEPAAAGAACSTTGQQNTAVLLVAFPDTIPPGISPATVYDIFFSRSALSLTNFWREASQGKTWAAGDVFGWYTLDRAYTCDEYMEMRAAAIRAAAAHVDFQQYQRIVVVFPSTGNCRWAALASFGCNTISSPTDGDFTASSAWLAASEISRRDQGVKLAVHMGGHNLTLSHASALNDPQSGLRNLPQYSAPDKVRVGWLDSETNIQTVESSGVFTLNPSQRNSARIQALKVRRGRGDDASLWIEYFQPASSSSIADVGQSYSGVLIRYDEAGTLKTELIGIPSEPLPP